MIILLAAIVFYVTFTNNMYKNDASLLHDGEISTDTAIDSPSSKEDDTESDDGEKGEDTEESTVNQDSLLDSYIIPGIKYVSRYPELPNGCEVTALDSLLRYMGFDVDKCDLSDNYPIKFDIGTNTAYEAFIDNPRNKNSYGCYAPVIVKTANKYLEDQGSNLCAVDLSGVEFTDLFLEVYESNSVLVWATSGMNESYLTTTWNIDGEDFTWRTNEHCLVLYGYDKEENIVHVMDHQVGNTTYDLDTFQDRYNQLYK